MTVEAHWPETLSRSPIGSCESAVRSCGTTRTQQSYKGYNQATHEETQIPSPNVPGTRNAPNGPPQRLILNPFVYPVYPLPHDNKFTYSTQLAEH